MSAYPLDSGSGGFFAISKIINATEHVAVIRATMGTVPFALSMAIPVEARAAIPICVQPNKAEALPIFLLKGASARAVAFGFEIPTQDKAVKSAAMVP